MILNALRSGRAAVDTWNTQVQAVRLGDTWTVTYTAPAWSTWATGPVEDLDGILHVAEYMIAAFPRFTAWTRHTLTPGSVASPGQWRPSTVAHLRTLIGQPVECRWTDPTYTDCTFGATGTVMRSIGHRDRVRGQLGADIGDGRFGQFIPPTADLIHLAPTIPVPGPRRATHAAG